jgi:hypothetical protein
MQDTHRTSVNAGFYINVFSHSDTAVSHLNGRRPGGPDHPQVYVPYSWLLLVRLQAHLDLQDFGCGLPFNGILFI